MAERKCTAPELKERAPTILVVEDEILIRVTIVDYLQECGLTVLGVSTGEEAVAVLESSGIPIDLVFSDVRMPGAVNGFQLARWIREHRPTLPVILTSGDAKKAEAVHELCVNEPFLVKPYDLRVVIAQIRQLLDAKKRVES